MALQTMAVGHQVQVLDAHSLINAWWAVSGFSVEFLHANYNLSLSDCVLAC